MNTKSTLKAAQYHDLELFWKSFIIQGLNEDSSYWDWTTRAVSQGASTILKARLIAKSPGIWAGDGLFTALRSLARDHDVRGSFQKKIRDGVAFRPGQLLCSFRAPAEWLLRVERPLINTLAFASGIATQTRSLVDLVERRARQLRLRSSPRVVLTRKTLPYYRDVSISAVIAGGGSPHRTQLSAGVLIKENHIARAGSIAKAIAQAKKVAPHTLKVEIEVKNLKELKEALSHGAEIIMLDNFSPEDVSRALQTLTNANPRPIVEVSGGIGPMNISRYVQPGVDVISCGCLTHSVTSSDLSLLFE